MYCSMSDASRQSCREDSCVSINEFDRIEKTRSASADDGSMNNTLHAADVQLHVGNSSSCESHHTKGSMVHVLATSAAVARYNGSSDFISSIKQCFLYKSTSEASG